MKTKNLYLVANMALLVLLSCTDEVQEMAVDQPQALKQIVMTTQDFQPEAGGRTIYGIADGAVTCTWAENDTVGVFPNEGIQTCFPMTSGAGTKNASFDGGGWALKDGYTYASYYPYIGNSYLDKHAVPVSYSGQTQVGNASMAHLGAYDYMVATPTAPEYGSANFVFKHLSALVQLKLTIPQPATITSVKLATETDAFAVKGKVDIMANAPVITPVTSAKEVVLDLKNLATTESNQVVTLYMMLPPADLSAKTLKAVVTTDKGDAELVFGTKNFKAGTAYALNGVLDSNDEAGYKDGVVRLAKAGTMKELLGKDYLKITTLKVEGPINGDDVYYLRKMLGGSNFSQADWGKLTTLDLSNAIIVEGGDWYYEDSSKQYYTSNNIVGDYMFYQCANLQSLSFFEDVCDIGLDAFKDCKKLTSVYYKDISSWYHLNFESIASNPLCNGSKLYINGQELVDLVISNEVTTIKPFTFSGCTSLVSVTFANGVTAIGERAFDGCINMNSAIISEDVVSIGEFAFSNSGLGSINIPNGIINQCAFYGCSSLRSITIGDNVTSIGKRAFFECRSLMTVSIGNGITSIKEGTFWHCQSLSSVTIGKNITTIEASAFIEAPVRTFVCYASEPPVFKYDYYFVLNAVEGAYLYVPSRSGSKYKSSDWGQIFKNIKEM